MRPRPASRAHAFARLAALVAAPLVVVAISCDQPATAPRENVAPAAQPISAPQERLAIFTCTLAAPRPNAVEAPRCERGSTPSGSLSVRSSSAGGAASVARRAAVVAGTGAMSPPDPIPPAVPFGVAFRRVTFDRATGVYAFDVAIANTGEDPIGTPDGAMVSGVFAFLPSPPEVLQGSGSVMLVDADGVGNFSGPNQPFFDYPEIVQPGMVSSSRRWAFQLTGNVVLWTFSMAVVADAPKPPTLVLITAGYYHTCGLNVAQKAYCWGNGEDGQRGDGSRVQEQTTPVAVKAPAGGNVLIFDSNNPYALSAGGQNAAAHTCGIISLGRAACWGNGEQGQLGDGTAAAGHRSTVPIVVTADVRFTAIEAGGQHTCALTLRTTDVAAGLAYCWGANASGQLGDQTVNRRSTPVAVKGGIIFDVISAGETHTCAVSRANDAWCWGDGTFGQRGDNSTAKIQNIPVKVRGGLSFKTISAGSLHTCALTTAGDAYCWGNDEVGQLGDGRNIVKDSTPTIVAGGLKFTTISAGGLHTCAVSTNGKTYCWGDGEDGQRGDNTNTAKKNTPQAVVVPAGLGFRTASAGGFHTCALTNDARAPRGKAYCWGFNFVGQLGNGTTDKSLVPVAVKPLP